MQNKIIAGIAVVALILAGVALAKPAQVKEVVKELQGASDSFSFPMRFDSTVTVGGKVFSTSSVAAATFTAANLRETTFVSNTGATIVSMTLPASSTFSNNFIPRPGDARTIYLQPTTAQITLVGATGTDLNSASSSKICSVGGLCRLDFVRKANTDIEVLLTSGI